MKLSLKWRVFPLLVAFVAACYLGLAAVNGHDSSVVSWGVRFDESLRLTNPFAFVPYFVALLLSYIIRPEFKHQLIYLRRKHPLPGSRVFTELIPKDDRISKRDLEMRYGTLPSDPRAQNRLWYQVYKSKEDDPVVQYSHARWLLFRDMFIICLLLLLPSVGYTFWHTGVAVAGRLGLSWIVMTCLLWMVARNSGERFACNVLVR